MQLGAVLRREGHVSEHVGLGCDIAETDAYVTSRREQKKVEMLFAHLKRILRLDLLRLRGPMVPETSSISPQQPRTSGNSQSSCRTGRRSGPRETRRLNRPNPTPASVALLVDFFNTIGQLGTLSGHLKADSEKVVAASMLDAITPSTLSTASAPSRKK